MPVQRRGGDDSHLHYCHLLLLLLLLLRCRRRHCWLHLSCHSVRCRRSLCSIAAAWLQCPWPTKQTLAYAWMEQVGRARAAGHCAKTENNRRCKQSNHRGSKKKTKNNNNNNTIDYSQSLNPQTWRSSACFHRGSRAGTAASRHLIPGRASFLGCPGVYHYRYYNTDTHINVDDPCGRHPYSLSLSPPLPYQSSVVCVCIHLYIYAFCPVFCLKSYGRLSRAPLSIPLQKANSPQRPSAVRL